MQLESQKIEYYSKNPWPLGIHTIPNEVSLRGQETMRLKAECFLGPEGSLNWEVFEFTMARGSCFYPMACIQIMIRKRRLPVPNSWEIQTIPQTTYST